MNQVFSVNNQEVFVKGPLTFLTARSLYTQALNWFAHKQLSINKVNLKEVTEVDSAGLTILIEWKRMAKKHQMSVQFVHVPESLKRLAELSHVSTWLMENEG